jgi:hypothetical protein
VRLERKTNARKRKTEGQPRQHDETSAQNYIQDGMGTIYFTICLCISSDLDGYQGTMPKHCPPRDPQSVPAGDGYVGTVTEKKNGRDRLALPYCMGDQIFSIFEKFCIRGISCPFLLVSSPITSSRRRNRWLQTHRLRARPVVTSPTQEGACKNIAPSFRVCTSQPALSLE